MEDSTCCKERPERFLQLSFEDKKCYIANLSLMGEIDPLKGFTQRRIFPRFSVASITEVTDSKVAS